MKTLQNASLSDYTAYGTGGPAKKLIEIETVDELKNLTDLEKPIWFLGDGSNSLISDKGLPGTVIRMSADNIEFDEDSLTLIADSGVWWDDLVKKSVDLNLWGLALTSEIPGSVGAAVVGNIAAYGQAVKDSLSWVDVVDIQNDPSNVLRLKAEELGLGYRFSNFQNDKLNKYLIVRAAFKLSKSKTMDLEYAVAMNVADEHGLDSDDLHQRREIIIKARIKQGSILRKDDETALKTTGSFFRNPNVSEEQVDELVKHDDWGISKEQILKQNKVHGGDKLKISAALVLLAAGFKAGQSWGNVRLHPSHVLKVENTGKANSQEIYDVTKMIQQAALEKTGILLEPEVRFMGEF